MVSDSTSQAQVYVEKYKNLIKKVTVNLRFFTKLDVFSYLHHAVKLIKQDFERGWRILMPFISFV